MSRFMHPNTTVCKPGWKKENWPTIIRTRNLLITGTDGFLAWNLKAHFEQLASEGLCGQSVKLYRLHLQNEYGILSRDTREIQVFDQPATSSRAWLMKIYNDICCAVQMWYSSLCRYITGKQAIHKSSHAVSGSCSGDCVSAVTTKSKVVHIPAIHHRRRKAAAIVRQVDKPKFAPKTKQFLYVRWSAYD